MMTRLVKFLSGSRAWPTVQVGKLISSLLGHSWLQPNSPNPPLGGGSSTLAYYTPSNKGDSPRNVK